MPTPRVESLGSEIFHLREATRMFVAYVNADTQVWFGGSHRLQYDVRLSLVRDICMAVRRLTDPGSIRNGVLDPRDADLLSVYRVMAERGREAEAKNLLRQAEIVQIRTLADKMLAHGNVALLATLRSPVGGVAPDLIQPGLLSRAVHAISRAFVQHVEPLQLDIGFHKAEFIADPFRRHVQRLGLPVLDFHLTDVFFDRTHLRPEIRSVDPRPTTSELAAAYVRHYRATSRYAIACPDVFFAGGACLDVRFSDRAQAIIDGLTPSMRRKTEERLKRSPPSVA